MAAPTNASEGNSKEVYWNSNQTIAQTDGGDPAIGATTDAASTQGGTGTVSAKLRLLTSQMNTLAGYLDGVETAIAAATPAGSNLIGKVGIDQTTPGTTNRVQSGGTKARVSASKTRPADTTAYTAKDAIAEATSGATVWTFTGMARATGGAGYIVRASILTDQTTCVEAFRLHLYNAAPTALQDNAACTAPLYADAASYVGTIDFPACRTEGTGATAAYANATPNTSGCNLPMSFVTNADANLYGLLETLLGLTPANGQKFTVILSAEED